MKKIIKNLETAFIKSIKYANRMNEYEIQELRSSVLEFDVILINLHNSRELLRVSKTSSQDSKNALEKYISHIKDKKY